MAFTTISGSAIDIKKTVDKPHIGFYSGKRNIETKIGPQVVWEFTGKDGVPFGIYGFTNLNSSMLAVKVGSLCRITYKGKKRVDTKYGKDKEVHQVMVEVDKDAKPDALPELPSADDHAPEEAGVPF